MTLTSVGKLMLCSPSKIGLLAVNVVFRFVGQLKIVCDYIDRCDYIIDDGIYILILATASFEHFWLPPGK